MIRLRSSFDLIDCRHCRVFVPFLHRRSFCVSLRRRKNSWDERLFAFAGLWESWNGDEEGEIRFCTVLTADANDLVGEVHHRMPIILPSETYDLWLDPAVREAEQFLSLLVPYPTEDMEAYPVSRRVNNPSNDKPRCVESVA